MMHPDFEILSAIFSYEPDTGVFRWKVVRAGGANGGFVKAKPGDLAGKVDPSTGYVRLRTGGKKYWAHRVAWLLTHGTWPEHLIDHRNGVKTDNWIKNLRDGTRSFNQQNRKRASKKNRSTGVLGVTQVPSGSFVATICIDSRSVHLGTFDTAEDASARYLDSKRERHPGNTL